MAQCVLAQREQQLGDADIDWAAEVAVSSSLRQQLDMLCLSAAALTSAKRSQKSMRLEVLLTGATGFLGCQLLRCLLQAPEVQKVHCVAVPADEQHLLQHLQTNDRTAFHIGNLPAPDLSLDAAQRTHLKQAVDVIVHAGAMGHCLNPYSTVGAQPHPHPESLLPRAQSLSAHPIRLSLVQSRRVAE